LKIGAFLSDVEVSGGTEGAPVLPLFWVWFDLF